MCLRAWCVAAGNREPDPVESHVSMIPHDPLKGLGRIEPLLTGEAEVDGPLPATNGVELAPVVFQHLLLNRWPRCVLLRTRRR